ncbi:MAG: class I SAM-dependent methyltransferase [Rhodospirillales bacterium]|nr:class I SAM-dependent methyltransferase [Rhodospirillales bacterium]USO08012.1 MAG: class I SAM-dependent methyltransferase [Rhodospirillales bacterium]
MTLEPATPAPSSVPTFAHDVMLRAKHMVSCLLLPDGSTVLDLDCGTGALTAAMAALNPRLRFIGADRARQAVMRARARFRHIENLSFEIADSAHIRRAAESVDAVTASNVLGTLYSRADYDEEKVAAGLESMIRLLKPDGTLVICDYAMPPADEEVQIEFPIPWRDNRSFRLFGNPLAQTQGEREIALLQWFAENARARDAVKGFFLEEISPHVPHTRLFRLPARWAYEFIVRKVNIRNFRADIGHQFAVLGEADYDRILARRIGARVTYTAPWRDAHTARAHFDGAFRLYTADGKPRPHMPAAHIVIARKTAPGRALRLEELRPSPAPAASLTLQAVRDERTGEVSDVVARDLPRADIIPYFRGTDGRIKVVLRADAEKDLANTVPRTRRNLDGKRWSGHMPAPATFGADELEGFDHASAAAVARLMIQKLDLCPAHGKMFETGLHGYPSPGMIDERLETLFIEIQSPDFAALRVAGPRDALGLKAFDAEDVLRATGAGVIPSAWLDIQIQTLMKKHGMPVTPWLHEAVPLAYDPPPDDRLLSAAKILKQKPKKPDAPAQAMYVFGRNGAKWPCVSGAFRPIRGRAGQVSTHRSSFVEQGRVDGTWRSLAAHEADFATPAADMLNIAAIMPLTEDLQGNTLAGFEFVEMPVPARFGQSEAMLTLPTLPLPASVTDIDSARSYIAAQFDVEVARVAPMGESFFTFIDMTPQRVYPFMLTRYPRRRNLRLRYMATTDLILLTDTDFADSILWKWGFANALLCHASAQVQGYDYNVGMRMRAPAKAPKRESAAPLAPASAHRKNIHN